MVSVRQNLTLLIDGGRAAAGVDCVSCWGATLGGVPDPARSALGITADGHLIWAGGEHLTVAALVDGLLAARVVRAVESISTRSGSQLTSIVTAAGMRPRQCPSCEDSRGYQASSSLRGAATSSRWSPSERPPSADLSAGHAPTDHPGGSGRGAHRSVAPRRRPVQPRRRGCRRRLPASPGRRPGRDLRCERRAPSPPRIRGRLLRVSGRDGIRRVEPQRGEPRARAAVRNLAPSQRPW